MDPFVEKCSEHHFSILQTCIPANKEKGDVAQIRKEMYFKNEQMRTRKEYKCMVKYVMDHYPGLGE